MAEKLPGEGTVAAGAPSSKQPAIPRCTLVRVAGLAVFARRVQTTPAKPGTGIAVLLLASLGGLLCACHPQEGPAGEAKSWPEPMILVPFSKSWRYESSGRDLGKDWKRVRFDDSGWASGPGPLGFGGDMLPIPLRTRLRNNGELTYYFRTTFIYTNEPGEADLTLTNLVDGGAVIDVNGEEVMRLGMGPGEQCENNHQQSVKPRKGTNPCRTTTWNTREVANLWHST